MLSRPARSNAANCNVQAACASGHAAEEALLTRDRHCLRVQSVSVSQKVDAGGYTGNATTGLVPTQTLLAAFDFIDSEVWPDSSSCLVHVITCSAVIPCQCKPGYGQMGCDGL